MWLCKYSISSFFFLPAVVTSAAGIYLTLRYFFAIIWLSAFMRVSRNYFVDY
nr:MAG TPA: hypothetical protein [Caudoviricetes sp.]